MSNSLGALIAVLGGGILVLGFAGIGVYLIYNSARLRQQAGASQGDRGANASLIIGILFLIVSLCLTCPAIFILLTGVFSTVTRRGP